jgi:peptide subunit release factor 1 (eRF1)
MVSYEDIEMLKAYVPQGDGWVLSLYLDVDQSKASNLKRGFETVVHNLLRDVERGVDERAREEFELNRARLLRFLRSYEPRKKSLVVFCDARHDFWWDRDLPVSMPSVARFENAPYLRPLIEALDEYERYGVVLMDKEKARFFTVYMGEIQEHEAVFDEVPRRTVTTSMDRLWSQKNLQRHHDAHVHWHAVHVAERLRELVDRYRFDRLIIGGTVEAVGELMRVLPKRLSERVAGTISLPVTAPTQDVLAEVIRIEEQVERQAELQMVDALLTAAAKGDRAVVGPTATLEALNEGRVWRFVYAGQCALTGSACAQCGALFWEPQRATCWYCGGTLAAVPGFLNRVLERVLALGGSVEEVRGPAAERLETAGGIGAFLRY